jgi:AraC-like DNA-binding protein
VLDGSDRRGDVLWISPAALKGDGVECWVCHTEKGKKYTGAKCGSALIKNRFLSHLFDELDRDLQGRKPSRLRLHLLSCMVFALKRDMEEGRAELPQSRRLHQPVEQLSDFVEEACEYIESNLDSSLTISRVSQAIGVPPATLTRYFRFHLKCSFNEYLTCKRLEAAESYLKDTVMPISRIARHVGISYDQLRTLIHKKHDCSPSEFREKRLISQNRLDNRC